MAKGTCKAGFSEEGYTAWVSHNIPKGGKLLKGRTTGVQAGGAVSPGDGQPGRVSVGGQGSACPAHRHPGYVTDSETLSFLGEVNHFLCNGLELGPRVTQRRRWGDALTVCSQGAWGSYSTSARSAWCSRHVGCGR